MATWSGTDLSAGPPNYDSFAASAGKSNVSASPHESDDDEVGLLKSELRRLRDRNIAASQPQVQFTSQGPVYQHASVSNAVPNSSVVTPTFTAQGPVYQHPVVSNAVPNTSADTAYTSSGDVGAKSCMKCVLIGIFMFVVVVVLLALFL